jgi:HK97 family phage prohead protease
MSIDALRKDIFESRIKFMPGFNRVHWSAKDLSRIQEHIYSQPLSVLRSASAPIRHEPASRSAPVPRAMPSDALNFLFKISSNDGDRAGDTVDPNGVDCIEFNQNPCVLDSHDSGELPIATATPPYVSGNALFSIAKFPPVGVAPSADQCAAAIRAGLVKGCSIGFIPKKWAFSKDSNRPFGIDYQQVQLLEYSVCAIPCNPAALLVGSVSSKALDEHMAALRQHEARSLTSLVGKSERPSRAATTREERIAEARRLINEFRH